MHRPSLLSFSIAALALAGPAIGQTYQSAGFMYRTEASASSRGALGVNAGAILTRIDDDDYRDWGVSSDQASKHDIRGIIVTVQDENLGTNESFTVEGYGENSSAPNTPDPSDNFLSSGAVPMPPGTGPGAFLITITFTTPAFADVGEDTFLGIGVPANAALPTDGLSMHMWTTDAPGAGMPASPGTYGHNVPVTTPLSARQFKVDPLLDDVSGVATAVTNQTSFPISNTAPGTASFFSGLHPDAANPPANAGRTDNPSFRIHDVDLAGDLVMIFLMGDFGPTIYLPAPHQGTFCANLSAFMHVQNLTANAMGEASVTISLGSASASIRRTLRGLNVVWWALSWDGSVGRGSPCVKQRF